MSNDLNSCNFIGRLGADPETRYMTSGEAVANFRIACGWKSKDKEGTEWVPCVAYGKLAEICSTYLKKGSQVFVQGRFKTRKYQDKSGADRYATEINVDTMQMLGSREQVASPASEAPQRSAPARAAAPAKAGGFDNFDDDIPFAPMGKPGAGVSWRAM